MAACLVPRARRQRHRRAEAPGTRSLALAPQLAVRLTAVSLRVVPLWAAAWPVAWTRRAAWRESSPAAPWSRNSHTRVRQMRQW